MLRLLTYTGLLFSGLKHYDFRIIRNQRKLKGFVDIHHIVPQEFRYHPTIKLSNYDIDSGYNLMFLPSSKGACILNIHEDRPVHHNGHYQYNRFVAKILDTMFLESKTSEHNLCKLNRALKQNMRHLNIPW